MMNLSVGHTYSSTVSIYVPAVNYSETEEIKTGALGQSKWTIYSASDDDNSKKKSK